MVQDSNDFILNPKYRNIPSGGKPLTETPSRWFGLALYIIAITICLTLVHFATNISNDLSVYYSHHTTQGRVVGGHTKSGEGSVSHYIQYRYNAEGKTRFGEDIVSRELYESLRKESKIPLQVSNINPDASCIQGQFLAFELFWQITILSGLFLFSHIGFISEALIYRRHSTCLKRGRKLAGEAVLTKATDESGCVMTANYSFKSPRTGKRISGKESLKRNELADQELPENPKVRLLYVDDRTHMML